VVQLRKTKAQSVSREQHLFWHIIKHPVVKRVSVSFIEHKVSYLLTVFAADDAVRSRSHNIRIVFFKHLLSIHCDRSRD